MSTETIHTPLLGIARDGDDRIPLSDGLSLVRPNDQLLARRWDEIQGRHEMQEEANAIGNASESVRRLWEGGEAPSGGWIELELRKEIEEETATV